MKWEATIVDADGKEHKFAIEASDEKQAIEHAKAVAKAEGLTTAEVGHWLMLTSHEIIRRSERTGRDVIADECSHWKTYQEGNEDGRAEGRQEAIAQADKKMVCGIVAGSFVAYLLSWIFWSALGTPPHYFAAAFTLCALVLLVLYYPPRPGDKP